ncbi:threonine synthase [Nautilia sp. PV-1]|uniref:threonine synthase n=1 Tax=Nautilia sp. PV-1 TaxID=2579250 RepID=UPI000FD9CF41|nr:threonine synthase [Nautilia sp. PV-1]AZV47015.1 threonine synthase [Nautilia sp. PV-1]
MKFIGTRGTDEKKSFSEVILNPAAPNGGLYVPSKLPKINEKFLHRYYDVQDEKPYTHITRGILKLFKIDIDERLIEKALYTYLREFDDPDVVPVVRLNKNLFVGELWHGPTRAFKDMALQPFGVILSSLAKQRGENYLILAATSGDTGPATLKTFENRDNIKVVCIYPHEGTSEVQKLQMVTTDAKNEKVLGIIGNFDDAQSALKSLLKDDDFRNTLKENNIKLSAANSVNFGRIIFQIIYHFWSYMQLAESAEIDLLDEIDVIIPSGNFGNALGAYYAKKMGLPINKIVIASNKNNILYEFIKYGKYDLRDKNLIHTISPAMDILKSSNVERVLFDKFGEERTKELMENLESEGFFELTEKEHEAIKEDFLADFATDAECEEIIAKYAKENNYIMDAHTATAIKAYEYLSEKGEIKNKVVAYSTAEWTKFAPSVYEALTKEDINREIAELEEKTIADKDAIAYIEAHYKVMAPESIRELFDKDINETVINKNEIKENIIKFVTEK